MWHATAEGDCALLQSVAHGLKGALSNLAAPIAARIAGELEAMARSCNLDSATLRLTELEAEMERVMARLESLSLEAVQ